MQQLAYHYVGPVSIQKAACHSTAGTAIHDVSQLLRWLGTHADEANPDGSITATYTIGIDGNFRLASRRSEHVACASGGPVLCAGEISFAPHGVVVDVNNYSTGFCPAPESWPECARVLDRIGVSRPGGFTQEVVFRLCPTCEQWNVVKDGWFVCELCGKELPK